MGARSENRHPIAYGLARGGLALTRLRGSYSELVRLSGAKYSDFFCYKFSNRYISLQILEESKSGGPFGPLLPQGPRWIRGPCAPLGTL